MKYFVYILECKDKSFYTGITWNLTKRIREHNSRIKSPLQKSKVPVQLVYWHEFNNIILAARREKEIKGWSRIKKIKLIEKLQLKVHAEKQCEEKFTLRSIATKRP